MHTYETHISPVLEVTNLQRHVPSQHLTKACPTTFDSFSIASLSGKDLSNREYHDHYGLEGE
jgi:hypothetical protein